MTTPDTDPIGELAQLAGDFLDNQCSAITTALPDDPSTVLRPMIEIVLEEAAAQQWVEKQIAETGLKSMDFRNGMSMDLEPARDMVAQWVGAARAMLGDAPNYTETPVEMVVKVGESPERYAFTLQRVGKITPHQARQKAEVDLDTMLRIITEYVVESNDIGGLDANDLVSRLGSAGFPLPDEDGEATP